MPLGAYTLYSPPPPAGGAILSLVLNVLKGKTPPPSHPESCPTGNSEPSWSFGQPSSSGSAPPQIPKMGLWKRVRTLCPRAGFWGSPRQGGFAEGLEVIDPGSPAPQVVSGLASVRLQGSGLACRKARGWGEEGSTCRAQVWGGPPLTALVP